MNVKRSSFALLLLVTLAPLLPWAVSCGAGIDPRAPVVTYYYVPG